MYSYLLLGLSASSMLGSLWYILFMLPFEKTQGVVQKIFFFHVPSAFCMYVFLILGAFFSVYFLFDRKKIFDQLAQAGMYTATCFATLVITSGPVWAKPIWGVYWTWDPRLTTSFIVFILLIAYCFTRVSLKDHTSLSQKAPVIGSILAILAVVDIPIIHFSVKIWRGLHPSVLKNPDGLAPEYLKALELMILSMFLFSALIFIMIFRYLKVRDELQSKLISESQRGAL